MSREWTSAQLDAINAKGGSLIVSAAAGSGKTAVLVERVLSRITDPANRVDIDKLLVVTYTKTAAAEMRERISSGLERLSKENPGDGYYRRQLMLLPRANISTIHSFCGNVIKENFYLLGDVPSDYKIADESRLALIRDQAAENVIENLYDSGDEGFRYMADCFSTAKGEYNLKKTVLKIYEFLCSQPFPNEWMDKYEREYEEEDIKRSIWGEAILREARLAADFLIQKADECIRLFESRPEIGGSFGDKLKSVYRALAEEYSRLVTAQDWDGLYEFAHRKHDFGKLSATRGYANDPTKIRIANICGMIKSEIREKISRLFIYNSEEYAQTTKIARPAVKALFKTVRLFSEEYKRLKAEENFADFSDLEHWTLELLYKDGEPTQLANELSDKFAEVMVDEYQDANEVQDIIFNCVSGGGKRLFVVGDVKQSIYRFRQANPELFLRRKNSYEPYDRESDNYPAKIILDKNFRSRSGIAECVNFIFSKLMSPEAGDMYYKREDMLVPAAKYSESDTPDANLDVIFAPQSLGIPPHIAEARLIAQRIIELKDALTLEKDGVKRAAKYGDFAVLLRSNTNALEYMNVLKSFGIPAQCAAGDDFLTTGEISMMISLLRVINNPIQDIPLLNVMTGPIFAFTPTELANIRADIRGVSLYESVRRAADAGDGHCLHLCDMLSYFRMTATSAPPDELLRDIYDKTSYPEIVSATEGGELKLDNLRLFYSKTVEFAESGGCLSSYIRYLDRLTEQKIDIRSPKSSGESNKVRIMTIHGSKGLEFPVCFVAGISSLSKNDYSQLLMHQKLGVGAAINYIRGPYKIESVQKQAIKMQQDIDEVSEELRVLYVALTRAKEKLYIVTSFRGGKPAETIAQIESRLDTERGEVNPYVVRGFSTAAQRLLACAILYGKNKSLSDYLTEPCGVYDGKPEDFWSVSIRMADEIAPELEQESKEDERSFAVTSEEIIARINSDFKNSELTKIPVKVSVSELAHKGAGRDFSFASRPAFLSKDNMTGAERGTAIHAVMQFADYGSFINDPEGEILRLAEGRFVSERQAEIIDKEKILRCLTSPIMQSYINAEKNFREYRFAVQIKAREVFDSLSGDCESKILLQGAVDCAFVEDGKIVIVDYKTDKVKNMGELAERYGEQLRLYGFAMRETTGLETSRRVIYSFELNDVIEV